MAAHPDFFPDILLGRATPLAGNTVGTVTDWIGRERESLMDRCKSAGAVLLRGFPISTVEDFDRTVQAFDAGRFSYRESLSNAVRIDLTDRVFTANEAPPNAIIRLHHELAQTPAHPRFLFFFCEEAPTTGGATSLCRSDALFEHVREHAPDFIRHAQEHGLIYHHVMPEFDDPSSSMGRSWRSTLSVETRDAAHEKLASLGYSWTWQKSDLAVTSPRLPAVLALDDGRRTFFNQLVATRSWRDARNDPETAVRLGNGDPIPTGLRDRIADWTDALAVDLEWQKGDLAIIDNHLVQHGRRPFQGARRVLVAFSGSSDLDGRR